MDSIKLGNKIRKLRTNNHMTQSDLGNMLHVSDKTISKWENGYSIPDIGVIKQLAKIFKVNINNLVNDALYVNKKDKFKILIKNILCFIKKHTSKIIVGIIVIFLFIFFLNNYNNFKIFRIKSESYDVKFNKSYAFETPNPCFLIIDDIIILNKNYEIKHVEVTLYTIINGEQKKLYFGNSLNRILVDDSYTLGNRVLTKGIEKQIKNNLYLKIDIIDTNSKKHKYNIKIDLVPYFKNNKFIYVKSDSKSNKDLNKSTFINEYNLINKGFKKKRNQFLYEKEIDDYIYQVDLESSVYKISKLSKNQSKKYYYYYNENVYDYLESKDNKIIMKYMYDVDTDILNCYIGDCSKYKEYNKYIRNKFFELSK